MPTVTYSASTGQLFWLHLADAGDEPNVLRGGSSKTAPRSTGAAFRVSVTDPRSAAALIYKQLSIRQHGATPGATPGGCLCSAVYGGASQKALIESQARAKIADIVL